MSCYARRPSCRTRGADRNAEVLKAFAEALGLSVRVVGVPDGGPDWYVGGWGADVQVEVKPPQEAACKAKGRRGTRKAEANLRDDQRRWHDAWRGARPWVVRTETDIRALAEYLRGLGGVVRNYRGEP